MAHRMLEARVPMQLHRKAAAEPRAAAVVVDMPAALAPEPRAAVVVVDMPAAVAVVADMPVVAAAEGANPQLLNQATGSHEAAGQTSSAASLLWGCIGASCNSFADSTADRHLLRVRTIIQRKASA
jgi:hypothetical protein